MIGSFLQPKVEAVNFKGDDFDKEYTMKRMTSYKVARILTTNLGKFINETL